MRRMILDVTGAVLVAFITTLLVWGGVVALGLAQQMMDHYPTQMLANAVLGLVVSPILLLYATRVGGVCVGMLGFDWNARHALFALAVTAITLGVSAGAMLLLDQVSVYQLTIAAPSWSVMVIGLVGQLGVAHEELLARGFILTRLQRRVGVARAIVISALLFTLIHVPFRGFSFMVVSWFLGGLLYAYLYVKSGSLWVALAAHVAHNWALDLFMYSREGISIFTFAATRLVGLEKIGFELVLALVVLGLTYAYYGRGTSFLQPAPTLVERWGEERGEKRTVRAAAPA